MATVTASVSKCFHVGDRKCVIGELTITGTNTSGGNLGSGGATVAQVIGLDAEMNSISLEPAAVTGGFLGVRYRPSNGSVQIISAVDATPAVNELSPELGAVAIPGGPAVVPFVAYGKGSVTPQ